MGVRVHLAVVVDRVSDATWHGIYEKARRVVRHWTPHPLSIAWRQIGAVRVAQYVLDIEAADGLHLVGLELLVVVDGERMRRRLAASLNAHAIDQAICELSPPAPHFEAIMGDLLGQLRSSPDARVRHELEHVVPSCPDPNILATGTRLLLHRLVEAIRSNMVRGEICQRVEQWGVARTREELAHRTLMSGMRLTSMAWDAIEAAELDELAFLYGAICMDTTRLEVHQAVRAVLENRVVRCEPGR